jgi:hypothetical protein
VKIQQNQQTYGMTRPPRENWEVGGNAKIADFQKDSLLSTSDLLKQTKDIPEDGVSARYTFQRDCSRMKPATMKQYGLAAAKGAAWGAVGGAACGLALNFVGAAFEIFTLGMLGHSQAIGLAIPAAMGTAVGTFIGCSNLHAEHSDYPHYGESVSGNLKAEYGPDGQKHLKFYPGGGYEGQPAPAKVELEQFAQAPIVGGGEPGVDEAQPQWWQSAYPNVAY